MLFRSRAVVLVVFFTIGLVFLLHYAIKTRKDPTKSYCYEEYKDQDASASLGEEVPMDWRRVTALIGFLVLTNRQIGRQTGIHQRGEEDIAE